MPNLIIAFLLWIDRLETETTRRSETGNENAIRNEARGYLNQSSSTGGAILQYCEKYMFEKN